MPTDTPTSQVTIDETIRPFRVDISLAIESRGQFLVISATSFATVLLSDPSLSGETRARTQPDPRPAPHNTRRVRSDRDVTFSLRCDGLRTEGTEVRLAGCARESRSVPRSRRWELATTLTRLSRPIRNAHRRTTWSARIGSANRSDDTPHVADSSTSTATPLESPRPRPAQTANTPVRRARFPTNTLRSEPRSCTPQTRTRFRHPQGPDSAITYP
jgi:hypothetical protein